MLGIFHPGSREQLPPAVDECANQWPGGRPTRAFGGRGLPVALYNPNLIKSEGAR